MNKKKVMERITAILLSIFTKVNVFDNVILRRKIAG